MEDSYGSGVEDLSSAAMELANARMAEQKRLQEEMRRLRGIVVGDRVRVRVRQGAPYPEPVKRYHYTSPFGGSDLGHQPRVGSDASPAMGAESGELGNESVEGLGGAPGGDAAAGVATGGSGKAGNKRRWKIVTEIGYVVAVRGNRVGIKRNGHLEDTNEVFPTYPKEWVEVLDVGEMWEIKTGPRNLGAFASDEDYAQAQAAWAAATSTSASTAGETKAGA